MLCMERVIGQACKNIKCQIPKPATCKRGKCKFPNFPDIIHDDKISHN